jgi:hypothetical protein
LDKGLIFRIYKELKKLIIVILNTPSNASDKRAVECGRGSFRGRKAIHWTTTVLGQRRRLLGFPQAPGRGLETKSKKTGGLGVSPNDRALA